MSITLIKGAYIPSNNGIHKGTVAVCNDRILEVMTDGASLDIRADIEVDATGCLLLPGVIDDHVHFREPGLTHKATIATESRAAVAGGVTTIFDMPNCIPQTTTIQALMQKDDIAAETSLTNYSFYLGATSDNIGQIESINPATTCGVKLFMGSSTGGMLVNDDENILNVFKASPVIVAAHCEDSDIINRNMDYYSNICGGEPPVTYHHLIRSGEACYESSARAASLADRTGAHLHLLHITTKRELSLLSMGDISSKKLTAEVCPAHLMFTDTDYASLGTRIKCNPAVKSAEDREALRSATASGLIDVVGTDHAPHLMSEKLGGCKSAASGMPVLPYSLPAMMELVDEGILQIQDVVRTMCHTPALLFNLKERGFIRKGYKADLTVIARNEEGFEVRDNEVPNRCGWSPFNGHRFRWQVLHTWVNGNHVYDNGIINDNYKGEKAIFDR